MDKVILQIPVSRTLRDSAERIAEEYGFSSLQEILRVLMKKISSRSMVVTFEETTPLSMNSEKRYQAIDQDIIKHKNTHSAKSVKQLMQQLHGDHLS